MHPEGKFVVDVDKNIDINDVSAAGEVGGWALLLPRHFLKHFPCPGDTQLPGGSKERQLHSAQDLAQQGRPTGVTDDGGKGARFNL